MAAAEQRHWDFRRRVAITHFWGLFDDDMGIGAADAERTDGASPLPLTRSPWLGRGSHAESSLVEIERWVWPLEMQGSWNDAMLGGQSQLDQSGGASRMNQVSDIALHSP